ncbi:MAG TPA: DUF2267 domain-containing protein [Pseudonocardia sp.]|jgi:uncharacterized protein (DUF2267 family)
MAHHAAHELDVFTRADRTAQEWLETVAERLETEDTAFAHRVLRAWLHTVRDRVGVDAAAHFAAQLPLLLRGLFYDGWTPSQVPVKYDAEQFLSTIAEEARISTSSARNTVAAVTAALDERCSPGQLDHLLAQLPGRLRALLVHDAIGDAPQDTTNERTAVGAPGEPEERSTGTPVPELDARIELVERDIATVTNALRALLHGLEQHPADDPRPQRVVDAAHRAHQILLTLAPRA